MRGADYEHRLVDAAGVDDEDVPGGRHGSLGSGSS
jgi:hypothetical protein